MQNKGYLFVALIVIVLMGAVIVAQQEQKIKNLPFCEYSTIINIQGQHEGFYVGINEGGKIVCAQPLTKERTVIDLGL